MNNDQTYIPNATKQSIAGPDAGEIKLQLDKILDSRDFKASERQKALLNYLVLETLAGRQHELKACTIATSLFNRKKDFDQALDPVVSIHANKLRKALESYYRASGTQDPVQINIPVGTYIPVFYKRSGKAPGCGMKYIPAPNLSAEGEWPCLMIRSFKNLSGSSYISDLCIALASDISVEIGHFQETRIVLDSINKQPKILPRFVIDGSIRKNANGYRISACLIDNATSRQIWSKTFELLFEEGNMMDLQEMAATWVATQTTGESGIIPRILTEESKNKPIEKLSAYEALLRFYEYDRYHPPEATNPALEALQYAVSREPGCSLLWSMLGRIHANVYGMELPGHETALETALHCTKKGRQIDPNNQRARLYLSLVWMLCDEMDAALSELDSLLAVMPNCLFMMDSLGYLAMLLGKWDLGGNLIERAIKLNPLYSASVHYASWVDWIRQGEYEKARLETLFFRRPHVFWEPLIKAATCGLMGNHDAGRQAAKDLLALKPEFSQRGRVLIGRYIKFEEISERIISGLENVGVKIV